VTTGSRAARWTRLPLTGKTVTSSLEGCRRLALLLAVGLLPLVPGPVPAQAGSASLVARVTDTAGQPLADAAVWVGMRISALTDEAGQVTIRDIPPGEHLVRFRHDAHVTESVMIAFERGARVEIEAELEPAIAAIPLPGITVHAERRPRHLVQEGFYSRREQGLGSFLEREEIARLGAAGDLCRAFDQLRGFTAWSPYGQCVVTSRRGVSLGTGSRACTPNFLVDGAPWSPTMVATLSPVHVEAIEGYAGPGTTPGRFVRGMANLCGTIVIWTRF
jgi:hypothetical protein